MGKLWNQARSAVAEDRYILGQHANQRLRQRGVPAWQILAGIEEATLLAERPASKPNPVVELRQYLPDGTPIKTVWA